MGMRVRTAGARGEQPAASSVRRPIPWQAASTTLGRMDCQLAQRVVLVVGGTGLIGRATVDRLAGEGATAVVASRSGAGGPDGTPGVVIDVADDASVARCVAQVMEEHGRLDGVVVAAAPPAQTLDPARSSDPAEVLAAVDAKAMGFLRVANAALPLMVEAGYGRIVGLAGQNALLTGTVAGSVRNAALIIAAKNLADAAAGSGVTVNTVSPGVVVHDAATTAAPAPIGRGEAGSCSAGEVADLIAFLVSPLAGAISGESIAVGHRVRGVTSM